MGKGRDWLLVAEACFSEEGLSSYLYLVGWQKPKELGNGHRAPWTRAFGAGPAQRSLSVAGMEMYRIQRFDIFAAGRSGEGHRRSQAALNPDIMASPWAVVLNLRKREPRRGPNPTPEGKWENRVLASLVWKRSMVPRFALPAREGQSRKLLLI